MQHKISLYNLRQKISQLNKMNPETANYMHLKNIFDEITTGIDIVVGKCSSSELFFRVRKSKLKLNLVSELGPPPSSIISGFQRCNPPKKPMFYTSSRRQTAVQEARVSKGDIIHVSQWMPNQPFPVNKYFTEQMAIPEEKMEKHGLMIFTYFETIFSKRIHQDYAEEYKFTSAISEILTQGFQANDDHNIMSDGLVAIRYPSVAHKIGGYNTAAPSEFFQKHFGILNVVLFEVLELDEMKISGKILDSSNKFEGDRIIWSGTGCSVPLPTSKEGVPFKMEEKKWRLLTLGSEPSDDYVFNFINE